MTTDTRVLFNLPSTDMLVIFSDEFDNPFPPYKAGTWNIGGASLECLISSLRLSSLRFLQPSVTEQA